MHLMVSQTRVSSTIQIEDLLFDTHEKLGCGMLLSSTEKQQLSNIIFIEQN
jgi:hypothetical protein